MDKDILKITKKPLKGDDGYKTFSVRLKNELVESIDHIADVTNRLRNELIGIFLNYAIENCDIEKIGWNLM